MSMGGGGGGNQGETKYTWNPTIESQWAGAGPNDPSGILSQARWLQAMPYQNYGNNDPNARVAQLDPLQQAGIWNAGQFGQNYASMIGKNVGSRESSLARDAINNITTGGSLDPNYGNNVVAGTNAYMGNNPYFQASLAGTLGDMVNAYQQGTAADTTRMMNLAGAFGGSAHQNAIANNEKALAMALGRTANEAYQQQYDRSANLAESDISRQLQAGQFNRAADAAAWQNNMQNIQNMVPQAFNADQAYNAQMANLIGAGDANRQYNQSLLDMAYANWQQAQQYPWTQLQQRANIVSQAQGGINPNAAVTSGYAPSISPLAGLLGAGLLYKGMT
jgi:hypothetical protein